MKLTIKIALVIAIAAALAAVGAKASWKWSGKAGTANAPYKVAAGDVRPGWSSGHEQLDGVHGWSWGDD